MIEFRIKEKTRSLNESFRGDWRPRAAAAKRQRTKAMQACPKWPGGPLLVVRLTRMSPGTLDFANLAGALKHAQDGVASRLGVDDGGSLVEWQFAQATGEAEVVVQIWKAGDEAPPLPVGRPVARRLSPGTGAGGGTKAARIANRLCGMGMGVTIVADGEKKRGRTIATVTADAGTRLRVVRKPGNGERRAPSPAYTPPEATRMHTNARSAAATSIAQATDRPVLKGMGMHLYNQDPWAEQPERSHVRTRLGPIVRKAAPQYFPPRAEPMDAAKEADETFAPVEPNAWVPTRGGPFTPPLVQPCSNCGDEYRPQCFDPMAPPGSVKCHKDVHCYRYDGHDGDCKSGNPRACTT